MIVLDDFNAYCSVRLTRNRIARLAQFGDALTVHALNLGNVCTIQSALASADFDRIVHLGAQDGVR